MQLKKYEFCEDNLHLGFDEEFTDIQIQKLEPIRGEIQKLDYLRVSYSFSSPKKEIVIHVDKESSYAIVIVNNQAYNVVRTKEQDNMELMGMGMVNLFKEVVPTTKSRVFGLDQLKNENISAQVKRRGQL
jgi:hypothetical protein